MNLPNKLTVLRIIMILPFLLVLYLDVPYADYWALGIFILASLTDMLDGKIARKRNLITDFGKFMDPLADKMLVTAAMVWFVEIGQMAGWWCCCGSSLSAACGWWPVTRAGSSLPVGPAR